MGLGEMSAVEPAREVNKEVGESISSCSLEMQGKTGCLGKWTEGSVPEEGTGKPGPLERLP